MNHPAPGVVVKVIMMPSLGGVYAEMDGKFIDLI
jgi:hypothetical protein